MNSLFKYIVSGKLDENLAGTYVDVYERIKKSNDVEEVIDLIQKYQLTWEMIPSQWLGYKKVWEALLPNLPYTALLRKLSKANSFWKSLKIQKTLILFLIV